MTAIDDLIRDSLKDVSQTVRVSPEELAHAKHNYARRRDQLLRRRRVGTALAAAAVVTGLALGASTVLQPDIARDVDLSSSAQKGLPVTVDNLAGTWLTDYGWMWEFTADETVTWVNPTGTEGGGPQEHAPYTITGDILETEGCDWSMTLRPEGTMTGVVTESAKHECVPGEVWVWTRLTPQPAAGVSLTEDSTPPRFRPAGPGDVTRVWWQPTSSRLLVITRELGGDRLTYWLDGEGELFTSPEDTGAATLDADGTLTLTSSSESSRCLAGSTARMEGASTSFVPHDAVVPPPANIVGMAWILQLGAVTSDVAACEQHGDLGGEWISVS